MVVVFCVMSEACAVVVCVVTADDIMVACIAV